MIITRTQKEIAQYLGVTPEYLQLIRTGKRRLSKKRQVLLKEFYDKMILELKKATYD